MNLRSKSKAKAVAPRAALETERTNRIPSTASGNLNLDEVTLRKLPRAELQKVAKAHRVKANMKSESIIQQLLGLQVLERNRSTEVDDPGEGTWRKRFKSQAASKDVTISPAPENHAEIPDAELTADSSTQPDVKDPHLPEVGPSAPRSTSPAHNEPTVPSYDKDIFSSTESETTEEEQLDFATPVSSRSGTPPAANVIDLERCVKIMQQISAQDVEILKEVTEVRETAAKLRKRARDVRDLVKAERGRRERMEAFFRYWQETEPTWDRKWLYGENMVPDYKIKLQDLDMPAGPPTIPNCQQAPDLSDERPPTPIPGRKQALSPEELKQKREMIVLQQEAERRQLEALRKRKRY